MKTTSRIRLLFRVPLLLLAATWIFLPTDGSATAPKPRLIVMTDIGGDPDDEQSIVRLLLYSCDLEVEALCTGFGHGHYTRTRPDLLHKAVDAYGKVLPNLLKHRADYPPYERMKRLVKDGSNGDPHSTGPGQDSEASDWIIRVLDREDPRPVWFSIWGGPRELAQAIWKVQTTRTPEQAAAFKRKIRVHSIADQDRTALWVKENHPDVFWIFSDGQFRGIWHKGDPTMVSPEWLERNVRTDHGPLGAIYPAKASGWVGVKEGDTPSFLYVLPNGLSDPERPESGNWGGRFEHSGHGNEFRSAKDFRDGALDVLYPLQRWRTACQNDFEARMDWCVQPVADANHEPGATLNGDTTRHPLQIEADPNTEVKLSAAGSSDPDGDTLKFRWWTYVEAGTYWAEPALRGADTTDLAVIIPDNASGRTIHLILEVTDTGKPQLAAYRRAVINVRGQPVPPPPDVRMAQERVAPPPTQFVPAPEGPWVFQRAVNVNGVPVGLDGQRWDGDNATDFACNGKAIATSEVTPRPPADAARSAMLTSFRFSRNLEVAFRKIPAGTYAVFAHIFEDNSSENLSFSVEGQLVERNCASGDAGHWRRLGPWVARVSDGTLDLTSKGGAANLSGIELWKLVEPSKSAKKN